MAKMEREMEEVFERKVREKRQKLADSQADLEKRHKESKDKLESQKRELSIISTKLNKKNDVIQLDLTDHKKIEDIKVRKEFVSEVKGVKIYKLYYL